MAMLPWARPRPDERRNLKHRGPLQFKGDPNVYSYDSLLQAIAPTADSREVRDPATGEVISRAPVITPEDVQRAIDAAETAQVGWAALSDDERRAYLHKAADAIEENSEALVTILSREQGKPLNGR